MGCDAITNAIVIACDNDNDTNEGRNIFVIIIGFVCVAMMREDDDVYYVYPAKWDLYGILIGCSVDINVRQDHHKAEPKVNGLLGRTTND